MNKYHNSKIYKITSTNTEKIYIGSTCSSLKKRFIQHKSDYKRRNRLSSQIFIFEDCSITLIENYKCNSKKELLEREGFYQKNNINCINNYRSGRTEKQYYIDKKDTDIIKIRAEKIKCICGSTHRYGDKSKHIKTKKHIKFIESKKIDWMESYKNRKQVDHSSDNWLER